MNGSVDALPPGAQLGQYRLIEAASQGGFGILYRAWDEKLNRPVAVKECFPTSICRRDPQTGIVQPHTESMRANYETAIEDVYEEVQTLAKLHHARVVPVYDVFRSAGSLFYVMPWLEGGSLRDRIAAGDAFSPETAQNWLLELLAALEYLHGMQVIHRDIKPGNIMFDAAGNPVLVDFGSALNRATKVDTTTQGEFSPVYASPEQVSGKGKIGPWTDLYSLAATWYELLTGNAPEPAQQRLVSDDLAPLPSGATLLEQSIMQNLALAPEERCQSAREWQDWLLRGAAPVAVARRRRSFLLWAVPAVLLAAGGAWLLKSEQAAAPGLIRETPAKVVMANEPSAAVTPVVVSEDFYSKVCQQIGIASLAKELQKITKQRNQLVADYKKQVDALLQQMQNLRDSGKDEQEIRRSAFALGDQIDSLANATYESLQQSASLESTCIAKLQDCLYSPEDVYPWKTQEEYMQLLKLKPMLERDFEPFIHAYMRTMNEMPASYKQGEIMKYKIQYGAY
ncbi:MAG: protein kinase [Akkermansia sp.]|nr:protein kinase [Akkermansia sp.]